MTGWRNGLRSDAGGSGGASDPADDELEFLHCQLHADGGRRKPLRGDQSSVEHMCAEFKSRRDVFVAGLNKIKGFFLPHAEGRVYVFPNITKTGWKSKPLADALLEQAGVAALSGTAFRRVRRRLPALQRG